MRSRLVSVASRAGAVVLALALGAYAQEAPPASVDSKIDDIAGRIDRGTLATVWDRTVELENLGADAVPGIAKKLEGGSALLKLGAAKALLEMEKADAQRGAAIGALKSIISGDGERSLKVSAVELLDYHGQKDEVKALQRDLDAMHDPYVKLAVLKALKKRKVPKAIDRMKELLASDDYSVRCEAALRLAECDEFEASKAILTQLKLEPSDRGKRARILLDNNDLARAVEKTSGLEKSDEILKLRDKQIAALKEEKKKLEDELLKGPAGGAALPGGALMKELEDKISSAYVDEKKAKLSDLVEASAKGMVDSLDPFSQYMTEKENADFVRDIKQEYAGIGAHVQKDMKSGYLTIVRPIYGGPAYKAGLRTLDQVVSVEGETTKDKPITDLVGKLKGIRHTKVNIQVKPFLGGPDAALVPFTITRDRIELPSVRFDMLPGKIGYLMLEQFGEKAADEVEAALQELEKLGMRALIFDLRGNPGGLLGQAVAVASKFLPNGKLVVYQKGREGAPEGKRHDFFVAHDPRKENDEQHADYPVVLLVDENSASASEIVSGCLQVHKRADLVGQTTFGKGSVQKIYPVAATEGKSALRLTIAYYYLPDGRCIHKPRRVETWKYKEFIRNQIEGWKQDGQITEAQAKALLEHYKEPPGGVAPDFLVTSEHLAPDVQKDMSAALETGKLETYIQTHWAKNKAAFQDLARWDDLDPAKYPDFDALYADLATKLSKDDVRKLVHFKVRQFAQDELAKVLPSDLQEDSQLQAAVWVVAQKIGLDLNSIGELAFVQKKLPKGVERNNLPLVGKKGPPDSAEDDEDENGQPKKKEEKKDEKKAPEKDEKKSDEKNKDF